MENEWLTVRPSKETGHWKLELAEKQSELYSQALDNKVIKLLFLWLNKFKKAWKSQVSLKRGQIKFVEMVNKIWSFNEWIKSRLDIAQRKMSELKD